jgi:SAM-dependent methyltransferase
MKIELRYLDGSYFQNNPEWDRNDAIGKAKNVKNILTENKIDTNSIVEVGCGSGDILRHLRVWYSEAKLVGYDISPQAEQFWTQDSENIEFHLADFHHVNKSQFDVLLMLDVFERVRDPFTFLENSQRHAKYFVFHIPLDLSAQSVMRKSPLMSVRRSVGHLNFYTKDLALETLIDCGYDIIDWRYTNASTSAPLNSLKTRLASIPRVILSLFDKDFAVRVLGGETLLVLAKMKS